MTSDSPSIPQQLAAKLARTSSGPTSTKIAAVPAAVGDDLPLEILLEIFSRLPVKSLLRFRSVSKLWRSLIGETSLVGPHFSRSLRNVLHHHFLITAYSVKKLTLTILSGDTHSGGGEPACLFCFSNCLFQQASPGRIKGVTWHPDQERFIRRENFRYLINPSTRQILEIPLNTLTRDINLCLYALGFSRNREEFKVLSINNSDGYECHILTIRMSGIGEWKKVNSLMPFNIKNEFCSIGYQDCVCIAGVMHWVLWKVKKIASFNLETESFSTMELPVELQASRGSGRHFYLREIDGCLAVVCLGGVGDVLPFASCRIDLWILKEYESGNWVGDIINLPVYYMGAYLTGSIPYSGEIVLATQRRSADSAIVPLYDRITRSFREVEIPLPPSLSSYDVNLGDAMVYTESLFSFRFLWIERQSGS
ncbi:PREDICTED: F-box protein At1g30790-like [Ipomoea nil]|uniref:F-box protein At1g30790-like n=1 Tax=Ipomoea nil TaxID=35883 RepID=UPI0009011B4B|nr:PREDICTED: F-box protein At1g30790-like [Ipomoea nil]